VWQRPLQYISEKDFEGQNKNKKTKKHVQDREDPHENINKHEFPSQSSSEHIHV
jgi:hypothetical protein